MTNERILKKAIEKAVENGYDKFSLENIKDFALMKTCYEKSQGNRYFYSIIFSHDFCRAFWGDEWEWQKRLEDMVLYKEPLKYLEQFIK